MSRIDILLVFLIIIFLIYAIRYLYSIRKKPCFGCTKCRQLIKDIRRYKQK
ncbi:MAG: hypothetical protein PHT03_07850 [Bacilli bacterium]|nr:hypothetical protein [Bacilli bacterium]MDD4388644.1 hypothetical protein [Bacilli bacterium]